MQVKKLALVTLVAALAIAGCGKSSAGDKQDDDDKSIVDKARGAADDLGSEARDRARDLADRARAEKRDLTRKAGERVGDVKDRIGGMLGRAEAAGDDAIAILRPYAEKSRDHAENLIVDGKQQAGKAAAIAAAVAPKVAQGVGIRPIYVEVGAGGDGAAIDAAIGRMPRVEVIDGLTVGFRALGKRQVLVAYRRDDHLVGFVYTSLTDMIIEHVIDQAPRLIPLVKLAIE